MHTVKTNGILKTVYFRENNNLVFIHIALRYILDLWYCSTQYFSITITIPTLREISSIIKLFMQFESLAGVGVQILLTGFPFDSELLVSINTFQVN